MQTPLLREIAAACGVSVATAWRYRKHPDKLTGERRARYQAFLRRYNRQDDRAEAERRARELFERVGRRIAGAA